MEWDIWRIPTPLLVLLGVFVYLSQHLIEYIFGLDLSLESSFISLLFLGLSFFTLLFTKYDLEILYYYLFVKWTYILVVLILFLLLSFGLSLLVTLRLILGYPWDVRILTILSIPVFLIRHKLISYTKSRIFITDIFSHFILFLFFSLMILKLLVFLSILYEETIECILYDWGLFDSLWDIFGIDVNIEQCESICRLL